MNLEQMNRSRLELLQEKKRRLLARQNLGPFTEYMLGFSPARHHQLICRKLEDVAHGKIRRLLIAAPPGSAKSTYTNLTLPAWLLGKYPNKLVVTASHTAELAETWSGKVRNLINDERYSRLFPETEIAKDARAKGHWLTTCKGEYFAVGVGGAVSGRRADYVIIDDPFKSRADAESPARRRIVYDWYKSDIYTRLKPGGCIILIATRWNLDDLSGRLLDASEKGEGDKWESLIFEAICEDVAADPLGRSFGEALWPEWQDRAALDAIRKAISVSEWNSLYMQRPAPLEGGLVTKDWFKWYRELPDGPRRITQSWDTASSEEARADPSVCTTWAQIGNNHYLLDVFREQMEFPDLLRSVKEQAHKWNPHAVLIENKGSGQQLVQLLSNGQWSFPVIKIEPSHKGSKVFRFDLVTPMFSSGAIYLPGSPDEQEKWVDTYVYEILTFPNNKNDDQVDSTSQYLGWATPKRGRGVVKLRG